MKVEIGNATLYLGDCRDIQASADLVLTSPPYAQQRDYGTRITDWDELMRGCFTAIQPSEQTQILVNLGQIHRDGEVVTYWEPWRDWMRSAGWRFFGWYVWDQGDGMAGNWNGRLAPSHEYIFHFNRVAVQPNKWVRPKKIRKPSGTGLRRADGTMSGVSSPDKKGQEQKIADSVIRVYRNMSRVDTTHPATFPVRLPEELAMSYSLPGQTVLDPFMGSGSTGVACANLGRKFIGIEIEPRYFELACERIEAAQAQQRLFA